MANVTLPPWNRTLTGKAFTKYSRDERLKSDPVPKKSETGASIDGVVRPSHVTRSVAAPSAAASASATRKVKARSIAGPVASKIVVADPAASVTLPESDVMSGVLGAMSCPARPTRSRTSCGAAGSLQDASDCERFCAPTGNVSKMK